MLCARQKRLDVPECNHRKNLALEDWIKNILDSATQTLAYRFEGPGELFFADLVMILSREIAKPIKVSNSAAVWNKGQGLANSVVLIQYIASKEGGMISKSKRVGLKEALSSRKFNPWWNRFSQFMDQNSHNSIKDFILLLFLESVGRYSKNTFPIRTVQKIDNLQTN